MKNTARMAQEIVELPEWNQTRLGDAAGVSQATVSRWIKGTDPEGPSRDRLFEIHAELFPSPATGSSIVVPLLAMISAGALMRDDIADEALGTITVTDLPMGDWIALKVVGDSMDRISPPDSTIFVDRRDKVLVPNGLYVIADDEGNATYKRFRPGPPKRFEPVSVNQSHEPIIPEHDPLIVGRVKRTVLDTM